ncbi:MAG: pyrroline-5-carboxylate reductase [Syntrophales bacterium]|jgi:pyrroline-5-carboxylate reductase
MNGKTILEGDMLKGLKLGFIGGGNMGGVLVGGLISGELANATDIIVSDVAEEKRNHLHKTWGVHTTANNPEAVRNRDIVVLAVKPQNMDAVLEEISGDVHLSTLIISIAAGIPTHRIERSFPQAMRVIRTMPNTPALITEGMSALARGSHAKIDDLQIARELFDAVGLTVEVDESLMDAVTGVSGSGPAYGFLFVEAIMEAAVQLGLDKQTALKLAAQTLLGAAKLCLKEEKTPAELRAMVTSPGGTTLEALKVLEKLKFKDTVIEAVKAATRRSRELAGGK